MINRHAVRSPITLSTVRDGKWRRVENANFVDARPEPEDLQTPAVYESEGWDTDVPF